MDVKCEICETGIAGHWCCRCQKKVCASCIDMNGMLCKDCRVKEYEMEGIRIGFAPLRKAVNLPLFIIGIAFVITGMSIITLASFTLPSNVEQTPQLQEPRGFIYIFPFPFVFGWGSPDIAFIVPIIIAVIALPILMMLLIFRNFARF